MIWAARLVESEPWAAARSASSQLANDLGFGFVLGAGRSHHTTPMGGSETAVPDPFGKPWIAMDAAHSRFLVPLLAEN